MTNRVTDLDGLLDQIDEVLIRVRLARVGVGMVDEQSMLGLSMHALDTAEIVEEHAIAEGDAADAIASVDREPATLLAGELRRDLARQLRDGFDVDQEAPTCCAPSAPG